MEMKLEYFDSKFEQMDKEKLLQFQFDAFIAEIKKAWEGNLFYRKKFEEAGILPDDIQTRQDILKLPVTTKEEFLKDVREHPPYGRRLQIPEDQLRLVIQTGGTTGKGQEVHALSDEDLEVIHTAEAYGFFWAGARKGSIFMQPWPIGLMGASTWWMGAAKKLGLNLFNIGSYGTQEKLTIMKRFKADIFFCDPSYLRRMEYIADEMGIDLKADIGLKSILTIAGGVSKEWVREREKIWGAKMFEQYGSSQRAITWNCEHGMLRQDGQRGVIHWLPHLCLIEVIDPKTGKHVAPNEEGEIVVTPLFSHATPIIRFATGDKGKYVTSDQCPCGRPFDGLASGSIERMDDMIKVKGVNIWQSAIDNCVLSHPEIAEYKGEIFLDARNREQIAIKLEFHKNVPGEKKEQLIPAIAQNLQVTLGLNFISSEWDGPSISAQREDSSQKKVRRWEDTRFAKGGESCVR